MIDGNATLKVSEKTMIIALQEYLNARLKEAGSMVVTGVTAGNNSVHERIFELTLKGAELPPLTKLIQERGL